LYVAVSGPVTSDLMLLDAVIVKPAVIDLAFTTILSGNDSFESVLLSAIVTGASAGAESVTVHIAVSFDPRVVGLHCNDKIVVKADRVRSILLELLLYAAVRVPFWFALSEPVLTVNCVAVAASGTAADAGTLSPGRPILVTLTTAPPAGAAFDSATRQLLLACAPKVVALHCSDEVTTAAARLIFTLCLVPL
jgi:hypothetical protein